MSSKLSRAAKAVAFGGPIILVLLACQCTGPGSADVSCQGAGSAIACDVTHTEGNSSLNVCWDMTLTCANGITGTGENFCQVVAPGETRQKSIALSEFTGLDGCDSVTGMQILNQTAQPQ